MIRPLFSFFALMYTHTFLTTSVRGIVDPPQTFAKAADSFFGAKMPFPAFRIASAFLAPAAFFSALTRPRFFFSPLVAFGFVVFFTVFFTVFLAVLGAIS